MEMDAPREARRWAVASAIPDAAPVIAMTLPSREVIMRRKARITGYARARNQKRI